MEKKGKAKGRIRLVFRRSQPLTKIVVLCAVVLSMAALLTLGAAILENRARTEVLRAQAAGLEQENSRLVQYIAELGTVQGIIRIAQEELGLVEPDTIIIKPEQ